jgi:predicted branched-subunit amino acid permease
MSSTHDPAPNGARQAFLRGAVSLLPLWAGAIPSGIAFGVAARHAGLGAGETQLMSLLVFSAAGQMGAVSLLDAGTSPALVLGTVIALNAQLLLLSVTVARQLRPPPTLRPLVAWLLTDGAYGVAAARVPLHLATLMGAGASMYAAWNLGTALGIAAGNTLVETRHLGLDLIVPLTFVAVLVPLLRTHAACLAGLTSALVALLLARLVPLGIAVLAAGLAGSTAGAWWARREKGRPAETRARAGGRR